MAPFEASSGYLPEGVHIMTLAEFMREFAWNARRRFLLSGLVRAIASLQAAGCRTVIVNGSFVTAKELPDD
jgi:phosphoserine phosphatase